MASFSRSVSLFRRNFVCEPTVSFTANIARSLHHQEDRYPDRNYLGASALI